MEAPKFRAWISEADTMTNNLKGIDFENETVVLKKFYCEDSGSAKIVFDKGMFKLLDIRTEKSVWDNLFDCIENCNVFLQGNIYENREILEAIK